MRLTYYGHACFRLEINEKHLLFDPFIRPNPLAASIDIESIPADYILLTHGHADHVADAAAIARRTEATIISNFEVVNWFGNQGLENIHPMNHGGSHTFDFGKVKYVNAVHSSSMPDGSNGGAPGGFVITSSGGTVYNAGDTALTYDMKLIGREFDVDIALLPIGDNFTMGYKDAVKASKFIKCKRIVGMHYDTFDAITIDHDAARKAFRDKGRTLLLPKIGESIEI